MIAEVAILFVKEGEEKQFKEDFKIAGQYISSTKGYLGAQPAKMYRTTQ